VASASHSVKRFGPPQGPESANLLKTNLLAPWAQNPDIKNHSKSILPIPHILLWGYPIKGRVWETVVSHDDVTSFWYPVACCGKSSSTTRRFFEAKFTTSMGAPYNPGRRARVEAHLILCFSGTNFAGSIWIGKEEKRPVSSHRQKPLDVIVGPQTIGRSLSSTDS
jgi:hypothetical protein